MRDEDDVVISDILSLCSTALDGGAVCVPRGPTTTNTSG